MVTLSIRRRIHRVICGSAVVLACSTPVSADPIILQHTSSASAVAGSGLLVDGFFGELHAGSSVPSLSKTISIKEGGVTVTASTTINHKALSAQRFSSDGGVSGTLSETSPANILATTSSHVGLFIDFRLPEPHRYVSTFTYSVHGPLDFENGVSGDGVSIEATLFEFVRSIEEIEGRWLFVDQFTSGDATIGHSGVLTPGRYWLSTHGNVSFGHCVGGCSDGGPVALFGRSSFNLTFDLTPAVDPIPEPASVVLLGTGLLGLMTAARQRGLRR